MTAEMIRFHDLDTFTRSYVEAALFTSHDDSGERTGGEPLDRNYDADDIAPETLAEMASDCRKFQEENESWLTEENYVAQSEYSAEDMAGYHFWLTRNGHGSGFWNGDWSDEANEAMTKASKAFGEYNLYLGDDGRIYGHNG